VVDAADTVELAAEAAPIDAAREIDFCDIPETDFSRPDAARGKYHRRFLQASGLVRLDPDLRAQFPDDAAVNRALRLALSRD